MARSKQRKSSIFSRLLLPLLFIVLMTVGVLLAALSVSGTFNDLRINAMDRLDERTQNKHQTLQTQMVSHWSNLDEALDTVTRTIRNKLRAAGATAADMKKDAALNADILLEMAPTLVSQLRTGGTTGVFVILNGVGVKGQDDTWAGVYLRDGDPANNTVTNSDIVLLRGLPPVSRALDISLDSYWEASFRFGETNRDFFFKPMAAVLEGSSDEPEHYGYWCMPFEVDAEDPVTAITYTMPILDLDRRVLGVMGVDLTANYLTTMLNSGEFIRKEPGSFVLGLKDGDTIRVAVSAGTTYKQYFNADDKTLLIDQRMDSNTVTIKGTRNGKTMYASVQPLALYSANTPFEKEEWVLLGMLPEESLLAFSNQFNHTLMVALAVALVLSLIIAIITSRNIISPITRLAGQVRTAQETGDLALSPTNIQEIDTLAGAIKALNKSAQESAERLATILDMTGLQVGVFESYKDSNKVYVSANFVKLLDCGEIPVENDMMDKRAFRRMMTDRFTEAVDEDIWRFTIKREERYMRYRQVDNGTAFVGTLLDVTDEIKERQRLERARDIDALTGILNRRAFSRLTQDLFGRHRDEMGIAVLIMVDLDNLKFLNTTYGHDTGDSFIRAFAHALGVFEQEGRSIVARRSGDEFYMLLYGYETKAELEDHIRNAWEQVISQGIVLPDGSFYRFRASGGMAWYPDDSENFSQLLHYADFAMYKVKHDAKGELEVFNKESFNEEAYLIDARAALDKLIDNQLMHFAYQPIVSVKNADLWGYELLMRPDVPELKSPLTVLRLAKAQGKLHHIERITWFNAMESLRKMIDRGSISKGAKIFINSIASQKMDLNERQHIIDSYSDLLPQVVLEMTESEDNNMDFTDRKMKFIHENGGMVALDDFGTGYNSELALVQIPCDIVKVDASFVRNVDKDTNKQALVKNLISYAKARDIAVLAEGVETQDEMATMIAYGVDYLQGFYLGMPREKPQQILPSIRMEIRQYVNQNKQY